MDKNITIEKYSFWKENRIPMIITIVCLISSIYSFVVGSHGAAALNAFVVILTPKWVRREIKGMKGGYSNKDFIDHLAEDLHSEVEIRIYDDK